MTDEYFKGTFSTPGFSCVKSMLLPRGSDRWTHVQTLAISPFSGKPHTPQCTVRKCNQGFSQFGHSYDIVKISWLICGQFLHKPHPCGIPLRTSETNQRNSVLKWKGCTNFTKEYTAKREGVCLLQEGASVCPFMQGKNLKTLCWCHQLQFLHGWSTMDREMAASRNSFTLFHVVSAHSTWMVLICLVSKLITLQASAHWSTARLNMRLSSTTKILLLQASYHSFTSWQLWKTLFYNNDQVCMSTELVCCPAKRRNPLKFVQIDHCQGVVRDPAHNVRVAV